MKKIFVISISVIMILYVIMLIVKKVNWNSKHEVGQIVDTFNGVNVYYNSGVSNSEGRNLSIDGYNLTLK